MAPPSVPGGAGAVLDETVQLSDWSPTWAALAEALREELLRLLGRQSPIEHIGSTPVEGLCGKPVIDLRIGVADASGPEDISLRLVDARWTDLGEAGVTGRRHLRRRSGDQANLHFVGFAALHWTNNLAIRDYLRAHPDERRRYAECKSKCASREARLLAYSACKAAFMAALLERAIAWRRTTAS